MKKLLLNGMAVAAASMLFTGCATILDGKKQEVFFTSTPKGAKVVVDGQELGVTPLKTTIDRENSSKMLVFKKDGYEDRKVLMKNDINNKFFINILSGGVFGSTTDYASKSMYEYKPGSFHAELKEDK